MKFIGYKNIKEYTKKSYVECTVFKVAVYEDKFGVRHDFYQPKDEKDARRPWFLRRIVPLSSWQIWWLTTIC